jgi:hypothetical protein
LGNLTNATAPVNTIDFVLTSATNNVATGSIKAVTDPNESNGNGGVVMGPDSVGTTVELTRSPGSPGQLLVMDIGGVELDQFCDLTAQESGECGA